MCFPLLSYTSNAHCPGPSLWTWVGHVVLVFTQTQTRDHEFCILSCYRPSKRKIILYLGTSLVQSNRCPENLTTCSIIISGLVLSPSRISLSDILLFLFRTCKRNKHAHNLSPSRILLSDIFFPFPTCKQNKHAYVK